MDIIKQIKTNIDPARYDFPDFLWNSLILNSRIRFHSFFRHINLLKTEENLALSEYSLKQNNLKSYIVTIIKYGLISFKFRNRKKQLIKNLLDKDIIVHKTFCYSSSIQNGLFKDPFFVSFTNSLSDREDYLIIVDPLMKYNEILQLLELKKLNILPWYSFLSIRDFFHALFIQIKYFLLFKNVKTSWDKEYKQELIHPTTFNHLLFYFAFKKITKTFKIKRFILTFENNSWEKVAIQTFRQISPRTIIAGYQHSVVPESTLGMRYLQWEIDRKNLPDYIYTTGLETEKIIKSFNPDLKIPIHALCAFRYEYLFSMPVKKHSLTKNILVALDAIVEVKDMINVILELKNYFIINKFRVTFRFHPAMTYDYFKPLINHEVLESFGSISTDSLSDDITNHDCVIYWGSTVALESSFIGNCLINFQSAFPFSHDPLYSCSHLKWVVRNSKDLENAIDEIYNQDLSNINLERAKIRNFIESYFHKPTAEHIKTLLGS